MFKKFLSMMLAIVLTLSFVAVLAACQPEVVEATGEFSYEDYDTVDNENYNKNLYYLNELKFQIADPSVIYVDHGEEEGYFYAYGTSDIIECHGIQTWRSRDLTNWEYRGVAFQPDYSETWAQNDYWAPEVLYDEDTGLYYMFYSAKNYKQGGRFYLGVAYSLNPYGPFECPSNMENADGEPLTLGEPVYDFSTNLPNREGIANHTIDIHPFIDPVSGDKYLYFSAYQHWGGRAYQEIYGCKMKDWFTPDYSTLKQLTSIYNTTVGDFSQEMAAGNTHFGDIDEGGGSYATVNEAPFMYYKDGVYYLTFSVYAYTSPLYQVRQAISDSPLGDYTKIQPEDGGTILLTDLDWGNITSAGHHCFIRCGDELMIAYHTFLNRMDINGGRALAVDRISFVENDEGQVLMHGNGPTYSYQPIPGAVSGYYNVAPDATVTADSTAADSDVKYLTDGALKVRDSDLVKEYATAENTGEAKFAKINLKFDNYVNARSILVYNSVDYNSSFVEVAYIRMKYKATNGDAWVTVQGIPFDYDWNSDSYSLMYPGGAAILEFDELPVNEIEIAFALNSSVTHVNINEIMVLAKEVENPEPVTAFESYSYTEPQIGEVMSYADSVNVGTVGGFNTTWGFGDLANDDGTDEAYIENTAPGDQEAYFKGAEGRYFYLEAEMTITEDKPYLMRNDTQEMYPKFGLTLSSPTGSTFFYIDSAYNGGFSNQAVGYTQRTADNSDYDWTNTEQLIRVPGLTYTGGNYAKLAVAKVDSTYYFFVNDELVATARNLRGLNGENVVGGFRVFNMGVRVQKYSAISGQEAVQSKIEALGVTA